MQHFIGAVPNRLELSNFVAALVAAESIALGPHLVDADTLKDGLSDRLKGEALDTRRGQIDLALGVEFGLNDQGATGFTDVIEPGANLYDSGVFGDELWRTGHDH